MNLITTTYKFINDLDKKGLYTYLIGAIATLTFILGVIGYLSLSSTNENLEKLNEINNNRSQVQRLIARYSIVKKQKQTVDKLIEKEEFYKMPGYFNKLLEELEIKANLKQAPKLEPFKLDNSYTEVRLTGTLTRLTNQQLTELLEKIEDNERIYTKRIEIDKSKLGPPAIDVTLTIATLNKTAQGT